MLNQWVHGFEEDVVLEVIDVLCLDVSILFSFAVMARTQSKIIPLNKLSSFAIDRSPKLLTPKLTILCVSLLFQPLRPHNIQLYASLQLPGTLYPKASHLCWLLA